MSQDHMQLTANIVAAYVHNNPVPASELPALIKSTHTTLGGLGGTVETRTKPAVPVNRSIHPDYIVCLEDGKQLKMLKRYIMARFKLTPDQYRQRWGLPSEYPMVAPNYAAQRSAFAKKIGLGRTPPAPRRTASKRR